MTDTATYTIEPLGPFSLAASARFIAGWPPGDTGQPPDSDIVRLAFVLDSFAGQAGASVREEHGVLTVTVTDPEHGPEIVTQAKRILSLNHDARDLPDVLARDPVAERRFQATGGLRPVLFHSPYEAAAWSIISARIQQRQGQAIRDQISRQFGRTVEVEGVAMPVFPTPDQLLAIEDFRGLTSEKLLRLHGVAEAALAGRLDPYRLRDLPDEEALAELQAIRGIGPFYAGLI
ncbi:MAG: DNA-3-methyladenine glycosylase family protein, partial [Chloroflexota bacterium]